MIATAKKGTIGRSGERRLHLFFGGIEMRTLLSMLIVDLGQSHEEFIVVGDILGSTTGGQEYDGRQPEDNFISHDVVR